MMIYAEKDAVIRVSTEEDVNYLSEHLRQADTEEIWASGHLTPKEALLAGIELSQPCYTLEYAGTPVAMFGIVPFKYRSGTAVIWLLGTDQIDEIKKTFMKLSRLAVASFLDDYECLYNFVDIRNDKSIRWLKWLGAEMSEPVRYGCEDRPFHYFALKKEVFKYV